MYSYDKNMKKISPHLKNGFEGIYSSTERTLLLINVQCSLVKFEKYLFSKKSQIFFSDIYKRSYHS